MESKMLTGKEATMKIASMGLPTDPAKTQVRMPETVTVARRSAPEQRQESSQGQEAETPEAQEQEKPATEIKAQEQTGDEQEQTPAESKSGSNEDLSQLPPEARTAIERFQKAARDAEERARGKQSEVDTKVSQLENDLRFAVGELQRLQQTQTQGQAQADVAKILGDDPNAMLTVGQLQKLVEATRSGQQQQAPQVREIPDAIKKEMDWVISQADMPKIRAFADKALVNDPVIKTMTPKQAYTYAKAMFTAEQAKEAAFQRGKQEARKPGKLDNLPPQRGSNSQNAQGREGTQSRFQRLFKNYGTPSGSKRAGG